MTQVADEEVKELQRDVQRLLGRCMLRLQQYERLIKAMIADHQFAGRLQNLEAIRAARADRTSRKTLGALIGEFTDSLLDAGNRKGDDELQDDGPGDDATVRFRMGISVSEEDFARTEVGLGELVKLRNDLVHHFIDMHDLWSVEGCRRAQSALTANYDRIDQCYSHLLDWAKNMERARLQFAEYAQTDEFRYLLLKSLAGEGTG